MAVSLEDVDHIARLARLGLTDDERLALRDELAAILGYIELLSSVDTGEVEATASTIDAPTPVRADRAVNDDRAERLASGAPDRDGTYLRVPKILE
jgi:aspartyl-tRNA(Asn)/glutamyl-tRNA(Gln) amidotransferase subunit C